VELSTLLGQPASILGLAGQSIDAATVLLAFEARINYFFFYNLESEVKIGIYNLYAFTSTLCAIA
jgi:hypothetical protein